MPTPVKLITWGTEYSEMLAEMGILEGEQSRFIRLLIDEAYRRFRAGNPVSVGETPKERYENLVLMKTILRQAEKRIAELSQAVGLITTLKPTMVMDTEHPLDMAKEVAEYVNARIAELEEKQRGTGVVSRSIHHSHQAMR